MSPSLRSATGTDLPPIQGKSFPGAAAAKDGAALRDHSCSLRTIIIYSPSRRTDAASTQLQERQVEQVLAHTYKGSRQIRFYKQKIHICNFLIERKTKVRAKCMKNVNIYIFFSFLKCTLKHRHKNDSCVPIYLYVWFFGDLFFTVTGAFLLCEINKDQLC